MCRARWMAMVLMLAVLAGCESPIATVPERQVHPSSAVMDLYLETASCIGEHGDLARVRWYASEITHDGSTRLGAWRRPHEIHLLPKVWAWLESPDSTFHEVAKDVVRHEAVHDILQAGNEVHGHPCDPHG